MMKTNISRLFLGLSSGILLLTCVARGQVSPTGAVERKAALHPQDKIMFADDFRGSLKPGWKPVLDAAYDTMQGVNYSKRLAVVAAPESEPGRKAVKFVVPRAEACFRSEISLPEEEGFHERWYGGRIYVPADWQVAADDEVDIVMQWHPVMGQERVNRAFPNLSIAIQGDHWLLRAAYGKADNIQRRDGQGGPLVVGKWVAWVVHARWNAGDEGLVEVWKDGEPVVKWEGPSVYDIRPRTPYFKTGIYHPAWKGKAGSAPAQLDDAAGTGKVIYSADFKMGNERATYADVAPEGKR
ncbi:MAG: polysaccharide lyase [Chthoniobacteraceae bacterium]